MRRDTILSPMLRVVSLTTASKSDATLQFSTYTCYSMPRTSCRKQGKVLCVCYPCALSSPMHDII